MYSPLARKPSELQDEVRRPLPPAHPISRKLVNTSTAITMNTFGASVGKADEKNVAIIIIERVLRQG